MKKTEIADNDNYMIVTAAA